MDYRELNEDVDASTANAHDCATKLQEWYPQRVNIA